MKAKRRTTIIAVILLAMSVTACGAAGETITRLAVGDPGPDAYTLAANADDDADVGRRAEAGGEMSGDAPGLYGGTRNASACDKDKLVEFLRGEPDKAGAWAGALGIAPGEIAGFVAGLTPAVLRVDTLITNHGYRNGSATSIPAVLQAGVAVLVDRKGMPVVKCNCGNPLTPPDEDIDPAKSAYRGTEWPQFSGEKVTVIATPEQEVKSLTLVDSDLGMAFERPVGTGGDHDGPPAPVPAPALPAEPVSTSGQPSAGTGAPGTTGTPARPDPTAEPQEPGPTDATVRPSEPATGTAPPETGESPASTGQETPSESRPAPPAEPQETKAVEEAPASEEPGTQDPAPTGTGG